jgi:hypothetical protein
MSVSNSRERITNEVPRRFFDASILPCLRFYNTTSIIFSAATIGGPPTLRVLWVAAERSVRNTCLELSRGPSRQANAIDRLRTERDPHDRPSAPATRAIAAS